MWGSPTIDSNGVAYFTIYDTGFSNEGKVIAVNTDGSEKWILDAQLDCKAIHVNPVIGDDNLLYVGSTWGWAKVYGEAD